MGIIVLELECFLGSRFTCELLQGFQAVLTLGTWRRHIGVAQTGFLDNKFHSFI